MFWWVIGFTLFIICMVFWGALIVGALVLIVRLAIMLVVGAVQLGLLLFGTAAWLVMFPFAPGRAMAALRGEEYQPRIRRDPTLTAPGLPPGIKIYRTRR